MLISIFSEKKTTSELISFIERLSLTSYSPSVFQTKYNIRLNEKKHFLCECLQYFSPFSKLVKLVLLFLKQFKQKKII